MEFISVSIKAILEKYAEPITSKISNFAKKNGNNSK